MVAAFLPMCRLQRFWSQLCGSIGRAAKAVKHGGRQRRRPRHQRDCAATAAAGAALSTAVGTVSPIGASHYNLAWVYRHRCSKYLRSHHRCRCRRRLRCRPRFYRCHRQRAYGSTNSAISSTWAPYSARQAAVVVCRRRCPHRGTRFCQRHVGHHHCCHHRFYRHFRQHQRPPHHAQWHSIGCSSTVSRVGSAVTIAGRSTGGYLSPSGITTSTRACTASTILDVSPALPGGGATHSVSSTAIALLGICASILSSTYIVTGAGTYTTTCLIPCIATNVSTDLATCSVSGIGTCTLTSSIVSITCTGAVCKNAAVRIYDKKCLLPVTLKKWTCGSQSYDLQTKYL